MSRNREHNANSVNKRGIVVERDPTKMRVKVQFEDEDEGVTHWVDVLASSSGGTQSFMMPGENDEVWCAMDAKGEDGCIMGSKYNNRETPPSDSNDQITLTGPFGKMMIDGSNLIIEITGAIHVKAAADITIEAGGDILSLSSFLRHNGLNVGDTHKHKDVAPGGALTGFPVR